MNSLTSHFNHGAHHVSKGTARAEPHKRTERIIEDSELPVVQCDYFVLKDVAAHGWTESAEHVRENIRIRHVHSCRHERRNRHVRGSMGSENIELPWYSLTSFLHCDPEPSLIKWAESVKSKRQERTVIRSSPRRSHQSNGGVETYQKPLQGQVRTMLAAMQERTQYRPAADSALTKWIVRHAAWLIPRFRGNDVQSPFYCAMGGPYPGKLVEFGETVLAHLPEVGKGSGNSAPKLADRWKSAVWLGKSDLKDEHLVRTDDGVVYARSVRRLAEHSWSEENLRSVVETPQKPRSTATDDTADLRAVPEVREHDNENGEKNVDEREREAPRQARGRRS